MLTERIIDEPDRSPLFEAQMIMKGLTGLQPTVAHLEALQEFHEVQLIRVMNLLDAMKQTVGEMA